MFTLSKKSFVIKTLGFFAFFLFLIPSVVMAESRTGNIYWTPPNVTINGIETDKLLSFIFWLTTFVFFATQTVYIYYLIKYRRRPGVKAHYSHGNNTLEIIWTTLPTLIFLGLAIYGNRVWYNIHRPPPEDALNVEITGYQFAWDMRYPGASGILARSDVRNITSDNKFGIDITDPHAKEDFTTTELVIPVGRAVHVFLRSRDVIHAFYVPEFRIYQDVVPGRTIAWVWFRTLRQGNFQLACSQLCGKGHYNMKAPIRVVSQEEYDKWYAEKIKKPNIVVGAPEVALQMSSN
ncbi:MAG TPA: cytochrome c oxidase subunit II [Chthoniobacterales bacterium]|nr:cytochrome c oxidase subunit II [Chthoniobacterales bacterium]